MTDIRCHLSPSVYFFNNNAHSWHTWAPWTDTTNYTQTDERNKLALDNILVKKSTSGSVWQTNMVTFRPWHTKDS